MPQLYIPFVLRVRVRVMCRPFSGFERLRWGSERERGLDFERPEHGRHQGVRLFGDAGIQTSRGRHPPVAEHAPDRDEVEQACPAR